MTDHPMSDETLIFSVADGIATITLNRPEKRNAFTDAMLDRWEAALVEAQRDPAIRAVILTGAGASFCSGGDVSEMGNTGMTAARIRERLHAGAQRIPRAMAALEKPTIAAINGAATGAGLDMALMCDIRFAAESARMAETYVRVGLIPGAGGAWLLPRIVGMAKALEMFWAAQPVDAAEALRIGLVNRVLPDAELMPAARSFAAAVAAGPPLSMRLIKRLAHGGATRSFLDALDDAAEAMTEVRSSADHAEAVAALREKRRPIFQGR